MQLRELGHRASGTHLSEYELADGLNRCSKSKEKRRKHDRKRTVTHSREVKEAKQVSRIGFGAKHKVTANSRKHITPITAKVMGFP